VNLSVSHEGPIRSENGTCRTGEEVVWEGTAGSPSEGSCANCVDEKLEAVP
jgi:hypothetical protein